MTVTEIRATIVRGQETTLVIIEGMNSEGVIYRQAAAAFQGKGGTEEPGWRGLMQPELQKRFSPLVVALIVSGFWSLWHLPPCLNGFCPGELVGGMDG